MKLGVVGNPRYRDLAAVLAQLAREAPARGLSLFTEPRLQAYWPAPVPSFEPHALDALLTFGGDGTLLRGARLLDGAEVPILGINLGKVGVLSKAEAHELEPVLVRLAAGEYRIEPRMALANRLVAHAPATLRNALGDERRPPAVGRSSDCRRAGTSPRCLARDPRR